MPSSVTEDNTKVRFVTYQNRVSTAEARSYADHFNISIKQAIFELENRTAKILEEFGEELKECS